MNFNVTSRKDDLVSLFQMMVFLLNDNSYVGTQIEEKLSSDSYDVPPDAVLQYF